MNLQEQKGDWKLLGSEVGGGREKTGQGAESQSCRTNGFWGADAAWDGSWRSVVPLNRRGDFPSPPVSA